MKLMIHIKPLVITLLCWFGVYLQGCTINPPAEHDRKFASVRPENTQPLPIDNGAIYRSGYEVVLFEDSKARRVGDLLTVILSESTNASKSAKTKTTKESDYQVPAPTLLGRGVTKGGVNILEADVEADSSFKGEGDSSQSNSLRGTLTVTVTEVLPNGNLAISGEKLLTLNQGSEHIRLSGIVRPQDISPQNSIESSMIANAEIIYGGEGVLAETNSKGWLQRFFDSSWWPF